MLDANMVSYIVRGRPLSASARLLALHDDETAIISAVTVAEIRYGLAKNPQATILQSLMDGFLAGIQILPWGRDEAETYGRVKAKMEKNGTSLESMDMMIAAHAVAVGAVLVTNDKAFAQVDELVGVVNWAAP